jgi:hypothetical protein
MSLLAFASILWLGGFCVAEPSYDPEEARQFASFTSATYCQNSTQLRDWSCKACAESPRLAPGMHRVIEGGYKNGTRAIVGKLRDGAGCALSFQGTTNWMDWVDDLEAWNVRPRAYHHCDGCEVHDGFYTMWRGISKLVLNALEEVGCGYRTADSQNIYVTGHSAGGAMAHLALFTLHKAGYKVTKMYSFEAPRVGNRAFAEQFHRRFTKHIPTFRITHYMDPVVHLPPTFLNYQHVDTEVYYDDKGKHTVCNRTEDSTCSGQFVNLFSMLRSHRNDHCTSSLVSSGHICWPDGCTVPNLALVQSPAVIV